MSAEQSGLHLVAPVSPTGYGVTSFNLLKAGLELGRQVALWPYGDLSPEARQLPWLHRGLANRAQVEPEAPCLRLTSGESMKIFAGRGARWGFPFFETDRLDPRHRHHLRQLDGLFVASGWGAGVLDAEGISAVYVAPLGVDRELFCDGAPRHPDKTVFLHVGRWTRRKAQDFMLDAFNAAFGPGDAVELRILSLNPFMSQNHLWMRRCRDCLLADKVVILPRTAVQEQVASLMREADCGLFPSRGEGWNLELLEMMSCGCHVIATNCSAHTEYCTPENAMLIEVDALEDAVDDEWTGTRFPGRWARLGPAQLEQMVSFMRRVHERKRQGALRPNGAGVATAQRLSWAATAARIFSAVDGGDCSPS